MVKRALFLGLVISGESNTCKRDDLESPLVKRSRCFGAARRSNMAWCYPFFNVLERKIGGGENLV